MRNYFAFEEKVTDVRYNHAIYVNLVFAGFSTFVCGYACACVCVRLPAQFSSYFRQGSVAHELVILIFGGQLSNPISSKIYSLGK